MGIDTSLMGTIVPIIPVIAVIVVLVGIAVKVNQRDVTTALIGVLGGGVITNQLLFAAKAAAAKVAAAEASVKTLEAQKGTSLDVRGMANEALKAAKIDSSNLNYAWVWALIATLIALVMFFILTRMSSIGFGVAAAIIGIFGSLLGVLFRWKVDINWHDIPVGVIVTVAAVAVGALYVLFGRRKPTT